MRASGELRVIDFSDGSKTVWAAVQLAPSSVRKEISVAVLQEIDIDAHEVNDIVGQVTVTDILGDCEWEYELADDAVVV